MNLIVLWPHNACTATLIHKLQSIISISAHINILLFNSPIGSLAAIEAVLPGSQSPTVMPLQGRDDMVAVHAVCEEGVFWDTMEDLKANGANSILVVPIEKMLD